MATTDRVVHRATVRARRTMTILGEKLREARIAAGLSQRLVASTAGMSRSRYTKVEAGQVPFLGFVETGQVAAVLGFDMVVRLYPGPGPLRDQAHAKRLHQLLGHVAAPLRARREVPLPTAQGVPELRAWDAVLSGHGRRTAIELETRLRDVQALERRLALKRRDDAPDAFLLVLADTNTNRRMLRENPGVFADLPRLRPSAVFRDLAAGRHPPSGLIVL